MDKKSRRKITLQRIFGGIEEAFKMGATDVLLLYTKSGRTIPYYVFPWESVKERVDKMRRLTGVVDHRLISLCDDEGERTFKDLKEPLVSVTKRFEFCYGHSLPEYQGKCVNFHGHNCILEVEVGPATGENSTYPGMTMDFKDIKKHVGRFVEELDHKNLNEVSGFRPNQEFYPPTAENMVKWFYMNLYFCTPLGDRLLRIRVYETPDSFAEWRAQ